MLWINVKRIMRSGFFGFFRNGFVSLSSVLVMVVTLFVIGSVIFSGAILSAVLQEIKNKVDVNVYFVTSAPEADILALKSSLEKLPEVELVSYVSREQELTDFRQRHKNDEFILQALNELPDNPLGAKLNIKAKEPQQYEGIATFLHGKNILSNNGKTIVAEINYAKNKDAIEKLSKIIATADKLGFTFTLVLALISILITFNTIRLVIFISKEEISVMRLVGASSFYIRGPFIISGIMYGAIAGILTLIIFYPISLWFGKTTANFFITFNMFDYYISNFPQIFIIIVGSGICIGAVSSYLAVRRYLKM